MEKKKSVTQFVDTEQDFCVKSLSFSLQQEAKYVLLPEVVGVWYQRKKRQGTFYSTVPLLWKS